LESDGSLSDIACPSCGSRFSLLDTEETVPYDRETRAVGHFDLIEQVGMGTFRHFGKATHQQNGQYWGKAKASREVQEPPSVGTIVRSTRQCWFRYLAVTARFLSSLVSSLPFVGLDASLADEESSAWEASAAAVP